MSSSIDDIHVPNVAKSSATEMDEHLGSKTKGPGSFISQHPGPIADDNISHSQSEVNEDWEASPMALQFSSLLDSNELRKRNMVAAQSMGVQVGGPNINLLNVLNGLETSECKIGRAHV